MIKLFVMEFYSFFASYDNLTMEEIYEAYIMAVAIYEVNHFEIYFKNNLTKKG